MLDLVAQAADFLQRAFGEDGEFARLAWQEFAAQDVERGVHPLQLLDRLFQDGGGGAHRRNREMPFLRPLSLPTFFSR